MADCESEVNPKKPLFEFYFIIVSALAKWSDIYKTRLFSGS